MVEVGYVEDQRKLVTEPEEAVEEDHRVHPSGNGDHDPLPRREEVVSRNRPTNVGEHPLSHDFPSLPFPELGR